MNLNEHCQSLWDFMIVKIMFKIFYLILLFIEFTEILCIPVSSVPMTRDNFIKVQNAHNIYVGPNYSIKKIYEFYINDTGLTCSEKYLPIMFSMKNAQNNQEDVAGYLSETGYLMDKQELSECPIVRRWVVLNKENNNIYYICILGTL